MNQNTQPGLSNLLGTFNRGGGRRSCLGTGGVGCAILVVIAVLGMFLLPRLFGDDDSPNAAIENPAPGNNPLAEDPPFSGSDLDLGRVVSAAGINQDQCPVDVSSTFDADEPIYIVAEDSDIPRGTTVFVRLFHEDRAVEDAPEITADQDYTNACVSFIFEPSGAPFNPGTYTAQFFANGKQAGSVQFDVR